MEKDDFKIGFVWPTDCKEQTHRKEPSIDIDNKPQGSNSADTKWQTLNFIPNSILSCQQIRHKSLHNIIDNEREVHNQIRKSHTIKDPVKEAFQDAEQGPIHR